MNQQVGITTQYTLGMSLHYFRPVRNDYEYWLVRRGAAIIEVQK